MPRARAAAQLLHRPSALRHPADVAREICGAQAQEPAAGRLAFRARSARLTAADVDRARTEERSLVRTWAMRSTMHLLAADDVAWLVPLFEPAMVANSRMRLGELGMVPAMQEKGQREIRRALDAGPMTRDDLSERLAGKGIELNVSTRMHMFRLAVVSGIACLGPDVGGRTCLMLTDDWLGRRPPHDRDAALRELARRYLRAFGPATEADFAGWAGLGVGDIRRSLDAVARDLTEVRLGTETGWALKRAGRIARNRIVRLLPGWDTFLMGYRDRDFIAAGADWKRIMPGGGILRPTVVVDGVGVGTWSAKRSKPSIVIKVDQFEAHDLAIRGELQAEAEDIGRFEGRRASLAN